jgi:hypothetical protein
MDGSDVSMTDAPPSSFDTQYHSPGQQSFTLDAGYTEALSDPHSYSDMNMASSDRSSATEHYVPSVATFTANGNSISNAPSSYATKQDNLRSALKSLGLDFLETETIDTIISNASNPGYWQLLRRGDAISQISETSLYTQPLDHEQSPSHAEYISSEYW